MIESLQAFTQSFPDWLQWFAVFLVAAIPFIESYTGTVIGVAIGMHPAAAASASIAGNIAVVLLVIAVTSRIRRGVRSGTPRPTTSSRRERVGRLFQRFGIPGVALLAHPTQISAAAMVGFGVDRRKVILWETISIVAWGTAVAVLAGLGIEAIAH